MILKTWAFITGALSGGVQVGQSNNMFLMTFKGVPLSLITICEMHWWQAGSISWSVSPDGAN